MNEAVDDEMLKECEEMIYDIDDYFTRQEQEHKANLARKNYKSV